MDLGPLGLVASTPDRFSLRVLLPGLYPSSIRVGSNLISFWPTWFTGNSSGARGGQSGRLQAGSIRALMKLLVHLQDYRLGASY